MTLGSGTTASDASDLVASMTSLPSDALNRLRDLDRGLPEVDVRPTKTEQFATPKAERRRKHVDGVEPGVPRVVQNPLHIVERHPGAHLVARGGDLHQLGYVAVDQLLADGIAQGVAEDGVHELDLPGLTACAGNRPAATAPVERSAPVVPVGAA